MRLTTSRKLARLSCAVAGKVGLPSLYFHNEILARTGLAMRTLECSFQRRLRPLSHPLERHAPARGGNVSKADLFDELGYYCPRLTSDSNQSRFSRRGACAFCRGSRDHRRCRGRNRLGQSPHEPYRRRPRPVAGFRWSSRTRNRHASLPVPLKGRFKRS
jgi:hypothetical protein